MANEVYIFQNGDTTTGGAAELAHSENAGGAAGQRNDIDDGNEHTAKIVYDRNVHKVFVYLDDMTRPLFNAQACSYLTRKEKVGTTVASKPCIDVSAMADKATGEMWVGLVGSTGYVEKRLEWEWKRRMNWGLAPGPKVNVGGFARRPPVPI
jgi:hypothetical protein